MGYASMIMDETTPTDLLTSPELSPTKLTHQRDSQCLDEEDEEDEDDVDDVVKHDEGCDEVDKSNGLEKTGAEMGVEGEEEKMILVPDLVLCPVDQGKFNKSNYLTAENNLHPPYSL